MESQPGHDMLWNLHPAQQATQLLAQSGLVSSAAVAGLRPGVLPGGQAKGLLEGLVTLALAAPHADLQQAAMVAAAAVVNKWPTGAYSSPVSMGQTACDSRS